MYRMFCVNPSSRYQPRKTYPSSEFSSSLVAEPSSVIFPEVYVLGESSLRVPPFRTYSMVYVPVSTGGTSGTLSFEESLGISMTAPTVTHIAATTTAVMIAVLEAMISPLWLKDNESLLITIHFSIKQS